MSLSFRLVPTTLDSALPLRGQVRLLGITVDTTNFVSLVEIDAADGSHELLAPLTSVNQRHALAYNPESGLAYHTAGGNSLHSSPDHEPEQLGFRDAANIATANQYTIGSREPTHPNRAWLSEYWQARARRSLRHASRTSASVPA